MAFTMLLSRKIETSNCPFHGQSVYRPWGCCPRPSSSCVWNPRVFLDDARECQCPFVLCLHPQGCLKRGVRATGSSQEWTGKSRSIGMWHHPVAHLEFPRADGLILRCAGKAWNPFQTTPGNRLCCRHQERRRGSDEVVSGPSVFPSREPGVSGNF